MRKLVLFAVPFGLGALLYVYLLSALWGLILGGAAAVCCLVFCLLRFEKKKMTAILAAGLAAGLLWSSGYELLLLQPVWAADGQKGEIEALVCDYPAKTDYGWKIHTSVSVNGRQAKTMLYLHEEIPDITPGDKVFVTATLQKTKPEDESDDYYSLAGGYVLRAYGSEATVEHCEQTPFYLLPTAFKRSLQTSLKAAVPTDAVGFLQALITGDKSDLPQAVQDNISTAGFSHVIAVSGMHVSILLGVIYLLTGKNSLLSAVLGIPIIALFAVMTGGSPSVVRAGIVQSVVLIAPLLRRESDGPTTLCIALLAILLFNPFSAASVSFQLSFGAILGIYLFSAKVFTWLSKPKWISALLKCKWTRSVMRFICSCIATTVGALVFTVPLCAIHFGTVSIYSLLSNLLVLSIISVLFVGGLLTALLGLVWLPGAQVLGQILAWPVRYIIRTAGWISQLPFASLSVETPYVSFWLIFAYLSLAVLLLQKERKQILLTGGCIVAGLAISLLFSHLERRYSEFHITVLDVGQGQCICMQTDAFSAMIDCGGDSGYETANTAETHLNASAQNHLDCLLLTHYDSDHANGVTRLLDLAEVDTLYLPDVEDDSGRRSEIETAAAAAGTEIIYVTQDRTLTLSNGTLRIFAPVSYYDDNAACLSVLFSVSEYDMLITGDMDFFSEYDLLLTHHLPDVELFVAGHHGSATSSSADLLAQIQPETVVISVGANNRYGHPTQDAIDRFLAVGAELYRTDECGTITIGR